jgi:hypothetical protein
MKAATLLWTTLALATAWRADADALADPMRPPSAPDKETHSVTAPLQITAILFSGGRRVAIVNGKAVSEGDHIDSARIDGIDEQQVNYTRAGHRESARLPIQSMQVRQRELP